MARCLGPVAGGVICCPRAHGGLRLFLGTGVYPKQRWVRSAQLTLALGT